ncbi:MAG TPA: hypothetical protein VKG87_07425, partial [Terriglobales bacterium]|nr:hypothetical protein [Terriglobales bacterium]
MPTPIVETWIRGSDGLLRPNRTPRSISGTDTFAHRTTIPDETNSGPGTGIYASRPLNPAADRVDANVVFLANGVVETTGGVTISTNGILENKVVHGTVAGVAHATTKKIRNCDVIGYPNPPMNISAGGGSQPLIEVLDHQVTTGGPQFEIEHCKVMPQTPSPHWESCVGNRGYKVKRSILRGTTDIFGVFGTNALGGYANIRVEDSVFGHIVFWQAASGGIVHPTDINTHGELIQDQGHLGGIEDVVFDGNAMWIRYDPAYGHVPTAPAEVPATVFALTCTPQSAAVLQSA